MDCLEGLRPCAARTKNDSPLKSLARSTSGISQKGLHQLGHLLSMAIQLVIGSFNNDGPGERSQSLLKAIDQLHLVHTGRHILICSGEYNVGWYCAAWAQSLLQDKWYK